MYNGDKFFDTDRLVDEVLKTPPQLKLSENFADVLAEKMARKFAWKQYFTEFMIYFGVIAGLVAVPIVIQFVLFDASWQVWLQFVASNAGLVAGIIILTVFVLFADRVLLRFFMRKTGLGSN